MKVSITIQSLLELYKQQSRDYLCWVITDHVLGPAEKPKDQVRDNAERKIEPAVFEFFNQYFIPTPTAQECYTVPMWFIHWGDDEVIAGTIQPRNPRKPEDSQIIHKYGVSPFSVRITMMEYILANYPEAVFTVEL